MPRNVSDSISSVISQNSRISDLTPKYAMIHTTTNNQETIESHVDARSLIHDDDDDDDVEKENREMRSSHDNNNKNKRQEVPTTTASSTTAAKEDDHHSTNSEGGVATLSVAFMSGVYQTLAHWKVLLFGQVLSFCMSAGGALGSTLHFDCNISAPAFQMMFCYFLMSLHLIPFWLSSSRKGNSTNNTTNLRDEQQQPQKLQPKSIQKSNNNNNRRYSMDTNEGIDSVFVPTAQYSLFGLSLHIPPWEYIIIAILVVEGNYFTYLAFGYTTFSSITLYDSLSIPTAMIASRYLLLRRYRKPHLTGTLICMIGVLLNMFVDYEEDKKLSTDASSGVNMDPASKTILKEYPDKALGDFLAIIGGLIYGLTTVLTEMAIKEHGNTTNEYIGVMGFFAFLISGIQATILERDEIRKFFVPNNDFSPTKNVCSNVESIFELIGFFIFMYLTYVGISYFLLTSEATLLNLSLLTADIWAVIFTVVAQKIVPALLFWVSLVLVLSGVFVYEMAPSPLTDPILPTDFIITKIICHHNKPNDDELSQGEYFDDPNAPIDQHHHDHHHTDASPKDPRLEIL